MEEQHIKVYENGVLVEVIDTRTLGGEKARRIASAKEQAGVEILEKYPEYKQRNAMLGLLSDEEVLQIKTGIQEIRGRCSSMESTINACQSLAELDVVY